MIIREQFIQSLKNRPEVDTKVVEKHVKSLFQPIFDEIKDEFYESIPTVVDCTKKIEKLSNYLKSKENGLPNFDVWDPSFIDEYFPEVRDQVLDEIENDDTETQYKEEFKKIGIQTVEEAGASLTAEMVKQHATKEHHKILNSLKDVVALTPKQVERYSILKEVQEKANRIKQIESETNQLKLNSDVSTEKEEKVPGKKKKVEKGLDPKLWQLYLDKKGLTVEEVERREKIRLDRIKQRERKAAEKAKE